MATVFGCIADDLTGRIDLAVGVAHPRCCYSVALSVPEMDPKNMPSPRDGEWD